MPTCELPANALLRKRSGTYLRGNHELIQPFILAHLFRPLYVDKSSA